MAASALGMVCPRDLEVTLVRTVKQKVVGLRKRPTPAFSSSHRRLAAPPSLDERQQRRRTRRHQDTVMWFSRTSTPGDRSHCSLPAFKVAASLATTDFSRQKEIPHINSLLRLCDELHNDREGLEVVLDDLVAVLGTVKLALARQSFINIGHGLDWMVFWHLHRFLSDQAERGDLEDSWLRYHVSLEEFAVAVRLPLSETIEFVNPSTTGQPFPWQPSTRLSWVAMLGRQRQVACPLVKTKRSFSAPSPPPQMCVPPSPFPSLPLSAPCPPLEAPVEAMEGTHHAHVDIDLDGDVIMCEATPRGIEQAPAVKQVSTKESVPSLPSLPPPLAFSGLSFATAPTGTFLFSSRPSPPPPSSSPPSLPPRAATPPPSPPSASLPAFAGLSFSSKPVGSFVSSSKAHIAPTAVSSTKAEVAAPDNGPVDSPSTTGPPAVSSVSSSSSSSPAALAAAATNQEIEQGTGAFTSPTSLDHLFALFANRHWQIARHAAEEQLRRTLANGHPADIPATAFLRRACGYLLSAAKAPWWNWHAAHNSCEISDFVPQMEEFSATVLTWLSVGYDNEEALRLQREIQEVREVVDGVRRSDVPVAARAVRPLKGRRG